MKIKTCPVAFNLDDPVQERMFKHLTAVGNRSSYLKMLIWNDMTGQRPAAVATPQVEETVNIDDSFMEDLV